MSVLILPAKKLQRVAKNVINVEIWFLAFDSILDEVFTILNLISFGEENFYNLGHR